MKHESPPARIAWAAAAVVVLCTGVLLGSTPEDAPGQNDIPAQEWRQIELRRQGLSMSLPYHWQCSINENAEDQSVLSAQDSDEAGNKLSANINIRFATRETRDYPVPDPDGFAALVIGGLRANPSMEDVRLVEARSIEHAGMEGVLIEWTARTAGVLFRARSLSLIASHPPRRFTVSIGSAEEQWETDRPVLDLIIDSISVE